MLLLPILLVLFELEFHAKICKCVNGFKRRAIILKIEVDHAYCQI